MNVRADRTPPVACIPSAIAPADRAAHFALGRELLTSRARERVALEDGYAFRFEAGELERVARFVANERRCCPFLDFELRVAADDGPLWLRMTGPEGTRAVLDAELAAATKQACGCD